MKQIFFSMAALLLVAGGAVGQAPGKIGGMTISAFNAINGKGGKAVAAITFTSTPLSAADQELFMQVAAGGQRQLAISQAVLANVTDPTIKLLATSEVEEQTGVSAKLKEIAAAKGLTLPDGPDAEGQALVAKAQALSGKALDSFYIAESGIKGHELLKKTMTTVKASAKDAALKKLAIATLPVINVHLSVAKAEKAKMKLGSYASVR